jgi:hypothetical protein
MTATAEPGSARHRSAALRGLAHPAVAGVLAAALTRAPHLRDLTLFDVDVYLTLGQSWWHGLVPYRDLFDNKGPFLYELFAGLAAVLPRSLLAVYLFGLAAFALSVWQLAALAGRHLGRTGAWVAAVAYGIGGSAIAFQGPEPNADQLAMLAVVAAVDCADRAGGRGRRRYAAAAGVALALAAGIKLGQLVVAPLVLALLLRRPGRRVAHAAWALAAFAGATALILLPFALTGTLGDLRFALVDYARTFLRAGFEPVREAGWAGKLAWLLEFPAWPLLLAGVVLGAVAWREPSTRRPAVAGAAWLLAAWAFSRSTGRAYPHYFVGVAPPLALLIGAGVDVVARRAPQARVAVAAVALGVACLPLALDGWRAALSIPAERRYMGLDVQPLKSVDEAAALVRRITGPEDRVFVATGGGSPGGQFLYWLADRRPAYRIFYPADVVPPRYAEVSAALARRPPDVLVLIPGTSRTPYESAIERGRLAVVARLPGVGEQVLEVYARPGLG